jgi:hypothetical protein
VNAFEDMCGSTMPVLLIVLLRILALGYVFLSIAATVFVGLFGLIMSVKLKDARISSLPRVD